jgi:hypothetical protein
VVRHASTIAVASVLAAALPSVALAHDPEKAARLFQEGRAAMDAHDTALACHKFAESEAEDPREGTLINLARCEEAQSKLATARQYWQQAADLARALGDPRVDYDLQELARIDGRVPRLTIRLEGDAPPDTVVHRDDIEFAGGSLGVALPVETGRHVVSATASGREPREYTVDLVEGEQRVLAVAPGPSIPVVGANAVPVASPEPDRTPSAGLRGLAYGLGGLGVVAIGTGVGFGFAALSDSSASSGHCQGDVCDAQGTSSRNAEQSAANVSTDLLLSGVALASAGTALRILTPSEQEAPLVRRRLAYLTGGLGLAAVSLGLVFGARAYQQQNESQSGCTGDVCNPVAAAERRDAIDAGNVSTVALVAGGVLLAGGVALWWTDPARSGSSTGGAVGVSVGGTRGGGAAVRVLGQW